MRRHVSCILLLEWFTTFQRLWVYRISVPYAQKDPRFLFEKRRGQPQEFWSLVSTIDGSTLPKDCVEDLLYTEHKETGKTYPKKKKKKKVTTRNCERGILSRVDRMFGYEIFVKVYHLTILSFIERLSILCWVVFHFCS